MLDKRKSKSSSKKRRKSSDAFGAKSRDKKLLKQLRQSQNKLTLALESAHIGIWEWNIKSNILNWSDNVHAIFGRDTKSFDGTFDGYFKMLHPEDVQKVLDSVQLSLSEGVPHQIAYRIIWPDGSIHWIEVLGKLIKNKKGLPQKMTGTVRDVTERKHAEKSLLESEDRFKNLIRDLNVGVILQDAEATIILSNSKALELLGLSMDQLLGRTSMDPFWRVIHEDETPFPGTEHPVPMAIRTLQPVRNVTMGVYRPNTQDLVWLLVNAEPLVNENLTLKEVVCTFTDITQRKNTEQELRDSEFRYRTLQEASFGGIAIHDKGRLIDCNQGLCTLTGLPTKSW